MYYAKNNISSNDNQMGNVLENPGNEDASNSNIDFNGYKLYVNGKDIN